VPACELIRWQGASSELVWKSLQTFGKIIFLSQPLAPTTINKLFTLLDVYELVNVKVLASMSRQRILPPKNFKKLFILNFILRNFVYSRLTEPLSPIFGLRKGPYKIDGKLSSYLSLALHLKKKFDDRMRTVLEVEINDPIESVNMGIYDTVKALIDLCLN
ncbi:MAG: hypothetical protein N2654_03530, partial [Deltaproteobacteria bacterium]|nr:hypothetical protein [Deltaproteobacteria bacterium]